jgi:WD40 repeat protein/tRNA A-37 threonylcarbamoyl transferase component Bud32
MSRGGQDIKAIFTEALEHPAGPQREQFLAAACGGDAALRRRVDELLAALEKAGDVLGPAGTPATVTGTQSTAGELTGPTEAVPPVDPRTTVAGTPSTKTGLTIDSGAGTASGEPETAVARDNRGTGQANGDILARGATVRYFGDYEIRRELGRGGMGVVYEARQVSLNRPVALKMVRAGVLAGDDELRRFQNEAEAIALLDHTGIVPIYEVGEHDGQRYFSMKLVSGSSLADRLAAYRDKPRAASMLLADVAEAVHHAHMRGILHRDLKPANILTDERGSPQVTDFGLAKSVDAGVEITASGVILGTPAYMSPEQAAGRRGTITTATDVYGLGSILYALLTGRAPFGGDSVIDTLQAVKERRPESPRKLNPKLPRDLEVICLKCLEKSPGRRYSSAQALADDLRAWLNARPIAARPVGPLARAWLWCRRRPAIATLSAALALVALAGLVAAGTQWRAAVRNAGIARKNAEDARRNASQAEANARLAQTNEQEALRRGESLARSNRRLRLAGYASAMQLAQREWELGNVSRVRALLAGLRPPAAEPDLRGFEWHYLRRQCDGAAFTLVPPPSLADTRTSEFRFSVARVWRIELSPDGKRLLAVIRGRLIGWEIPGGRTVALLKNSARAVLDARFSPDGKWLGLLIVDVAPEQYVLPTGRVRDASAFLEIWDLATGERLRATKLPRGFAGNLAFRPHGRQVAVRVIESGGPGERSINRVLIVDTEAGRVLRTQFEDKTIDEALAYSPDGSRLVGPGLDRHLNVWDAESGLVERTLDVQEVTVRDAAFRPDGVRLAVAGDSGRVTVWSVPRWEPLQSLRVGEGHARRCQFSPDGSSLATLGFNSIKLWDGATGEYRFLIRGASSELAFTPDSGRIAAAGDAATTSPLAVRLWDVKQEQGALVHAAKKSALPAHFSADGRQVICNEAILDASTGAVMRTLPSAEGEDRSKVVLLPDGKHAIFARSKIDQPTKTTRTGDLILWDVDAARELKRLPGVRFPDHCLDVSPDGRWLLTLSWREGDDSFTQNELTVRDATTWEPVFTRKDPPVYGINAVFSSDSKSILLGKQDRVTLIEVPSGREQMSYGPLPSAPVAMALSPDARFVAAAVSSVGVGDLTVHLWDAASRTELQVIPQTAGETVASLSFSPDGRRLASAGSDAKVKIWDTESGMELLTLAGHAGWILTVSFSPDGRRILSGGGFPGDHTIRIWDAGPLPTDAVSSNGAAP